MPGPPRFLESPSFLPCSSTPAGPPSQAIRLGDVAPQLYDTRGPDDLMDFEAQSHGHYFAVYASPRRLTRTPRKTRYRLAATLGRTGLSPAGLQCEVSQYVSSSVLLAQA